MSTSDGLPRRDVVFTFSFETWTAARDREMFRPPDRLLSTLACHPAVGRLLVANPYQSWPVRSMRRAAGRLREAPFECRRPGTQLVSMYRVRRRDPPTIRGLARTYRSYSRELRQAAARQGLERPAVITFQPFLAAFGDFDWAHSVTYYAMDDWGAHEWYTRYRRAYEHAYGLLRDRGTRVCAVSEPILAHLAPSGAHAVVPNGVDPDEWLRPAVAPDWFRRLPGPRIVYIGVLDGLRLDLEVLSALADEHAEGSVVLAGDLPDPAVIEPLRRHRNIHVIPPLGRADLVGVVAEAEVCVIPHQRLPLTESMSPLKLYEYLAAGRPVVTTDLPPVRGIDDRVLLAGDREEFRELVRRAIDLGPASEGERRGFIQRNAWARRHEQILEVALR